MLTATVTFVQAQATFVLGIFFYIRNISAVTDPILTKLQKDRFLGPSLTDANCHGDICQTNICLGHICPYQEYVAQFWPNIWDPIILQALTFLIEIFLPKFCLTQIFWDLKIFSTKYFVSPKFFNPRLCLDINFFE